MRNFYSIPHRINVPPGCFHEHPEEQGTEKDAEISNTTQGRSSIGTTKHYTDQKSSAWKNKIKEG